MKEQKLKALERKIKKATREETWFYPEHNRVKGWTGTQPIMFVGSNPSCNKFPTRYTDFFYEQLEKNGFRNAHLTDLIKIRARNNDADAVIDKTFNEQIKFFEEEIKIIEPKIIVIMGKRAERTLKKFNYENKRIEFIYHYSSIRFPKNIPGFISGMKKIKKLYSQK